MYSSKETSDPFPFMKLPPELRNRVYELAFESEVMIWIQRYEGRKKLEQSKNKAIKARRGTYIPSGALLRASRQMHSEALPICYHNAFGFFHASDLLDFLIQAGPVGRANVTEVFIVWQDVYSDFIADAFKLLASCKSLKILVIHMHLHWMMQMGELELARPGNIPGMNELKQIRGIEDFAMEDPHCDMIYQGFRESRLCGYLMALVKVQNEVRAEVTKPRPED